jgi:hypothetical protein
MNICALSAAKGMIFVMTINAVTSSTTSALLRNANPLTASKSSGSAGTAKLSEDEKRYDADGDGVLSAIEKAAMLEAQALEKTLKISKDGEGSSALSSRQTTAVDIQA